jgi:hypothetical protein
MVTEPVTDGKAFGGASDLERERNRRAAESAEILE